MSTEIKAELVKVTPFNPISADERGTVPCHPDLVADEASYVEQGAWDPTLK